MRIKNATQSNNKITIIIVLVRKCSVVELLVQYKNKYNKYIRKTLFETSHKAICTYYAYMCICLLSIVYLI